MVINFVRPQNLTKYAVSVASNCNCQIQSVCQINWAIFQINIFNITPITAQVVVVYFNVKSCIHTVINFLWPADPTEICRICPVIKGQRQISQNYAKTEITRKQANSVAWLKIQRSTENCGP